MFKPLFFQYIMDSMVSISTPFVTIKKCCFLLKFSSFKGLLSFFPKYQEWSFWRFASALFWYFLYNEVNSSYDQIVINPPIRAGKAVIYKMFEDSVKHLNENGSLYIVIKKNLGANSAITKLSELFKKVEVLKKDKGYFIIKAPN